ncbi:MAG: hypothetical protein HQL20_02940 [Candidatus Omnitrophica bacterium]|nr:hypothetical protein [Candidatus Omnitrophota bacterium]
MQWFGFTHCKLPKILQRRIIASGVLLTFLLSNGIAPVHYAQAQEMFQPVAGLVQLGTRVSLSAAFAPPLLKGVKVYPDNPFRLDFILDKGDAGADQAPLVEQGKSGANLRAESTRLIKYFLASITVPEKDLWVNLSPYEKDRIVPDAFGRTEMGRDLLSQDYLLKQITASVIYPEGEVGKAFWAKVYEEARKRFGTTDIPVDTFNKVWIVPEKAVVYESQDSAYVVETRLKVMLEADYLATSTNAMPTRGHDAPPADLNERGFVSPSRLPTSQPMNVKATQVSTPTPIELSNPNEQNDIAKNVLREIVIPILEKEVNEGKNFAQLRQVYNSLILAVWYKDKIKESLFGKAYVDRNKTGGVDIEDKAAKDKIWALYVEAFRKGAYNYIKDELDPVTQETVPRKYFSGGMVLGEIRKAYVHESVVRKSPSDLASLSANRNNNIKVLVNLDATMKNFDHAERSLGSMDQSSGTHEFHQETHNATGMITELMVARRDETEKIKGLMARLINMLWKVDQTERQNIGQTLSVLSKDPFYETILRTIGGGKMVGLLRLIPLEEEFNFKVPEFWVVPSSLYKQETINGRGTDHINYSVNYEALHQFFTDLHLVPGAYIVRSSSELEDDPKWIMRGGYRSGFIVKHDSVQDQKPGVEWRVDDIDGRFFYEMFDAVIRSAGERKILDLSGKPIEQLDRMFVLLQKAPSRRFKFTLASVGGRSYQQQLYAPEVSGVTKHHPYKLDQVVSDYTPGLNTTVRGESRTYIITDTKTGRERFSEDGIISRYARVLEALECPIQSDGAKHISIDLDDFSVPADITRSFNVTNEMIRNEHAKLGGVLARLEIEFGPMELEWSFEDGRLFIYQATPSKRHWELLRLPVEIKQVPAEILVASSKDAFGNKEFTGPLVWVKEALSSSLAGVIAVRFPQGFILVCDRQILSDSTHGNNPDGMTFRRLDTIRGWIDTSGQPVTVGAHYSDDLTRKKIAVVPDKTLDQARLEKLCPLVLINRDLDEGIRFSEGDFRIAVNAVTGEGQVHRVLSSDGSMNVHSDQSLIVRAGLDAAMSKDSGRLKEIAHNRLVNYEPLQEGRNMADKDNANSDMAITAEDFETRLRQILAIKKDGTRSGVVDIGPRRFKYTMSTKYQSPIYFRAGDIFVVNDEDLRGRAGWLNSKRVAALASLLKKYPKVIRLHETMASPTGGWNSYVQGGTSPNYIENTIGVLILMQSIQEDISGKTVIDLGSRNALIANAGFLLGAQKVVLVENDVQNVRLLPGEGKQYGLDGFDSIDLMRLNLLINGNSARELEIFERGLAEVPQADRRGAVLIFNFPDYGYGYQKASATKTYNQYLEQLRKGQGRSFGALGVAVMGSSMKKTARPRSLLRDSLKVFGKSGILIAGGGKGVGRYHDQLISEAKRLGLDLELEIGTDWRKEPDRFLSAGTVIFRPSKSLGKRTLTKSADMVMLQVKLDAAQESRRGQIVTSYGETFDDFFRRAGPFLLAKLLFSDIKQKYRLDELYDPRLWQPKEGELTYRQEYAAMTLDELGLALKALGRKGLKAFLEGNINPFLRSQGSGTELIKMFIDHLASGHRDVPGYYLVHLANTLPYGLPFSYWDPQQSPWKKGDKKDLENGLRGFAIYHEIAERWSKPDRAMAASTDMAAKNKYFDNASPDVLSGIDFEAGNEPKHIGELFRNNGSEDVTDKEEIALLNISSALDTYSGRVKSIMPMPDDMWMASSSDQNKQRVTMAAGQAYFDLVERVAASLTDLNGGRPINIDYPVAGTDSVWGYFTNTHRVNDRGESFEWGHDFWQRFAGDRRLQGKESVADVTKPGVNLFDDGRAGGRVFVFKGMRHLLVKTESYIKQVLAQLAVGDKILILSSMDDALVAGLARQYGYRELIRRDGLYAVTTNKFGILAVGGEVFLMPDTFVLMEKGSEADLSMRTHFDQNASTRTKPDASMNKDSGRQAKQVPDSSASFALLGDSLNQAGETSSTIRTDSGRDYAQLKTNPGSIPELFFEQSFKNDEVRKLWRYVDTEIKKHDPFIEQKSEGTLVKSYSYMNRVLHSIDSKVSNGAVRLVNDLRLLKADGPDLEQKEPLRIGVLALTANPLNWAHIMAVLKYIDDENANGVVLLVQGGMQYKDLPESDRVPEKVRHGLAKRVVGHLEPLIWYTDVGKGNENIGEFNVHELLALNPNRKIELDYLAGTETRERTYGVIWHFVEGVKKFGLRPGHTVALRLVAIGEFGRQVMTNERLQAMLAEVSEEQNYSGVPLKAKVVEYPEELVIHSTDYRRGDRSLVPSEIDHYAQRMGYYGYPPRVLRKGRWVSLSMDEAIKERMMPLVRQLAKHIQSKSGQGMVVTIDGNSASGKSLVGELLRQELRYRGRFAELWGLDTRLKDHAYRHAIQKRVVGESLSANEEALLSAKENEGLRSGQIYTEESAFFDNEDIRSKLSAVHDFFQSGRDRFILRVEDPYDQQTKTVLRSPLEIPLQEGSVLIVEGKYAHLPELQQYSDLKVRVLDDEDSVRVRFELRTRKQSPNDADRQLVFFRWGLTPSFNVYSQATQNSIDAVFDVRPDDADSWRLDIKDFAGNAGKGGPIGNGGVELARNEKGLQARHLAEDLVHRDSLLDGGTDLSKKPGSSDKNLHPVKRQEVVKQIQKAFPFHSKRLAGDREIGLMAIGREDFMFLGQVTNFNNHASLLDGTTYAVKADEVSLPWIKIDLIRDRIGNLRKVVLVAPNLSNPRVQMSENYLRDIWGGKREELPIDNLEPSYVKRLSIQIGMAARLLLEAWGEREAWEVPVEIDFPGFMNAQTLGEVATADLTAENEDNEIHKLYPMSRSKALKYLREIFRGGDSHVIGMCAVDGDNRFLMAFDFPVTNTHHMFLLSDTPYEEDHYAFMNLDLTFKNRSIYSLRIMPPFYRNPREEISPDLRKFKGITNSSHLPTGRENKKFEAKIKDEVVILARLFREVIEGKQPGLSKRVRVMTSSRYFSHLIGKYHSIEIPLNDIASERLSTEDKASLTESNNGGIDLTRENMVQQVQGGQGVQFKIDPAMIQQLQNSSGLHPVIIDFSPMTISVPGFLGLKENPDIVNPVR